MSFLIYQAEAAILLLQRGSLLQNDIVLGVSLPLCAVFTHPVLLTWDRVPEGQWQAALLCKELQRPSARSSSRTAAPNRQLRSASSPATGLWK